MHQQLTRALLYLLFVPFLATAQPSAEDLLSKAPTTGGVAVVFPATDPVLLENLAKDEKFLVQGLATDAEARDKAREQLRRAGLYGIATVRLANPDGSLPYADGLVNLLVADLDALGTSAPSEQEIARALAPGRSLAMLKQRGEWKEVKLPRSQSLDDWTHYDYDVEGTQQSRDKLVGPATSLQWLTGWALTYIALNKTSGFRSDDGVVVHLNDRRLEKNREPMLVARDAFSGVPLWSIPAGFPDDRQSITIHNGKVFFVRKKAEGRGGEYVAVDLGTGKDIKVYDKAFLPPTLGEPKRKGKKGQEPAAEAGPPAVDEVQFYTGLHNGGDFIWVGDRHAQRIDESTGAVKWEVTADNPMILPIYDTSNERLFVIEAGGQDGRYRIAGGRWPGTFASAIRCIDARTGETIWRNTEIDELPSGQLILDGDQLISSYGWANLALHFEKKDEEDGLTGTLVAMNAADGKTRWKKEKLGLALREKFRMNVGSGPTGFWPSYVFPTAAGIHLMGANGGMVIFDRNTGDPLEHVPLSTQNNHCVRPRATDKYFLMGHNRFVDFTTPEYKWAYQNVTRSGCASSFTPANGLLYSYPNQCTCLAQIRGFNALASRQTASPVPDSARLQPGGPAQPKIEVESPAPTEPKTSVIKLFGSRGQVEARPEKWDYGSDLRNDWYNNERPFFWSTDAVDGSLRVFHQEHRIEARKGDQLVWEFTADGRIAGEPVVTDGLVIFSANDGRVYAVDAQTGTLQWTFLAALADRQVVAYGQLESAWPAPNVVLHNGEVAVSAGWHPSTDGGIAVWGLNPKTGVPAWSKRFNRDIEWVPGDSKAFKDYRGALVNHGITVHNDALYIRGELTNPGGGAGEVSADVVSLPSRLALIPVNAGAAE